jgi:F-type H+-transporting ATPase subunit b
MPQIAQFGEIFVSQAFWLAVTFGALFLIVGLGMVPKIQGTVDARDAKIAADLATAATARETADRLEAEHRSALDRSRAEGARLAAEAKAAAAKVTETRVKAADQAAALRIEEASRRIAEARLSAEAELQSGAAEAAAAMVSRVAGLTVDEGTARAAIQQELVRG